MSAQKFEKLIDLIINEDQEQAEQLFHEIIVEKSREIYESIINQDESMGFQEEIEAEGIGMEGVMEEEDEFGDEELGADDGDMEDMDDMEDMGDEEGDMEDMGDEDMGGEEGDLEDRVVDLEDKLDELMAEFEAQMGDDEEGADEFGGEEGDDFGSEEGEEGEEESGLMEDVKLKQIGGKTYDKFAPGGDNGDQTKSPTLQNPKRLETGGKAVKFDGAETVPTSAKKPSNAYSKGETQVKDAGNFKNVPGKDNFSEKGESAPKAKHEDPGKSKSPVAESKTAKRRI